MADNEIPHVLQAFNPRGFVQFPIKNPTLGADTTYFTTPTLRVSVVDSAFTSAPAGEVITADCDDDKIPSVGRIPPLIATLIVPAGREGDWIFNSQSGLRRILMKFYNLSRLVVINNMVEDSKFYSRLSLDEAEEMIAQESLTRFIQKFHPQPQPGYPTPANSFVKYDDGLISSVPMMNSSSDYHIQLKIEMVEVETNEDTRDFRYRLTFKSCPDVVQSDIRLSILPRDGSEIPKDTALIDLCAMEVQKVVEFKMDFSDLIQPQVQGMVSALSVKAEYLQPIYDRKDTPVALCLGAGSCCLVNFLKYELMCKVVAVDVDSGMRTAAQNFLNLVEDDSCVFAVVDARTFIRETCNPGSTDKSHIGNMARLFNEKKLPSAYNMVFLDINSTVDNIGPGISSPTREFVEYQALLEISLVMRAGGVLVINVVSPDVLFERDLLLNVKKLFRGSVYRIDMKNDREFILIGCKASGEEGSSSGSSSGGAGTDEKSLVNVGEFVLMEKLNKLVPSKYLSSIWKV